MMPKISFYFWVKTSRAALVKGRLFWKTHIVMHKPFMLLVTTVPYPWTWYTQQFGLVFIPWKSHLGYSTVRNDFFSQRYFGRINIGPSAILGCYFGLLFSALMVCWCSVYIVANGNNVRKLMFGQPGYGAKSKFDIRLVKCLTMFCFFSCASFFHYIAMCVSVHIILWKFPLLMALPVSLCLLYQSLVLSMSIFHYQPVPEHPQLVKLPHGL